MNIPEGWKLVPIEPTPHMSVQGFCVSEAEHDPAGVYRAMIAAAPTPPAQGWCNRCGCGNDKYGYAHTPLYPTSDENKP